MSAATTQPDHLDVADPEDLPRDEELPRDETRPGSSRRPRPADGSVVVRRNAGLAALVGAAASAVAIAYLWRATESGALLDWVLCLALAVVAGAYLATLVDARTPLLVADELGVRIRLGHQWRGLPWDAVETVAVRPPRGRLRDGRLVFHPRASAVALEGLDARGRRAAALNDRAYGAALAVPLGLTTRVPLHGQDLADRLAVLARGAAEVVLARSQPPQRAEEQEDPRGPDTLREADDVPALPAVRPAGTRSSVTALPLRIPRRGVQAPAPEQGPEHSPEHSPEHGPGSDPGTGARPEAAPAGSRGSTAVRPRPDDGPLPLVAGPVSAPARSAAPVRQVDAPGAAEPTGGPVIGPELAAARVRVGLSVDELAERTRIRPHVIESIEVDDFGPCGGDFYARGHLRTLARVLGRDPQALVEQFDRRYATAPIDARRVFEAELATGMTGSMRSTTGGASWPLLAAVVLVLVVVWAVVRLFDAEPPERLHSPIPSVSGSAGAAPAPAAWTDALDAGGRPVLRVVPPVRAFHGS